MRITNRGRLNEIRAKFKKNQQIHSLIEIIKLALGEYRVDDVESIRLDDLDIDHVADDIVGEILNKYNLEVK